MHNQLTMVGHLGSARVRSVGFAQCQPEAPIAMQSLMPLSSDSTAPASLNSYPVDLQDIVAAVRAMVAQQKLGSERAIAEALNIKRHQLRRALQALRTNGEIAPAEAKRKSLTAQNGENLVRVTNPMEVIEMRIAIEPFLARLAALRASPFEIAAIGKAATTGANVDSGVADLKFHELVAAASGNKLATSLYSLLRRVARDSRMRLSVPNPSCPKRTQQRDIEHRVIAQAILARDPDESERAMRQHLFAVQKLVTERLNPHAAA
jgi:GntR family transcriptional regulator, transcriptional repressor for pyruvate dehydrogenase complex